MQRAAIGLIFGLGILAGPVFPHGPGDPNAVDPGHPTGHVRDRADQTWPPQPRGMRNVVLLGTPGAVERARELRQRRVVDRERLALKRADVRKALGTRYSTPELVESGAKRQAAEVLEQLVWFSYANNETVEVAIDRQQVRSVRRIKATEYQPDITDEEAIRAVAIARAHFGRQGVARIGDLIGHGILAHLPAGRGFYPTRVIYVSFHPDEEAGPDFAAWVDLSRERVMRVLGERS